MRRQRCTCSVGSCEGGERGPPVYEEGVKTIGGRGTDVCYPVRVRLFLVHVVFPPTPTAFGRAVRCRMAGGGNGHIVWGDVVVQGDTFVVVINSRCNGVLSVVVMLFFCVNCEW